MLLNLNPKNKSISQFSSKNISVNYWLLKTNLIGGRNKTKISLIYKIREFRNYEICADIIVSVVCPTDDFELIGRDVGRIL